MLWVVGDMFVLEYEWGGDVGMGRCGGDRDLALRLRGYDGGGLW